MPRLLGFTLVLLTSLWVGLSSQSAEAKYASIVMDAETGEVLHSVNPDTRNHPASLTKIMTLYMLFDALENKKLSFNSKLKVSRKASQQRPSKLGLRKGSTILVKDALLALVTKSANDVAVVVAESLAKNEAAFAKKMTAKAHSIGMKNTFFKNASGLHKKGQLSSARDMAILGLRIKADFPEYYDFFKTWKYKYKNRTYYNHNKLLRYYEGTDGIKTGFTNASGFNLVASVIRNERKLIGVVFGGRTSKSRNKHMVSLLDKGFRKLMIASLRPSLRPEISIAENGAIQIEEETKAPAIALAVNTNNDKAKPETPLIEDKPSEVNIAKNDNIDDDLEDKTIQVIDVSKEITTEWSVQVGAYRKKLRAYQAAGLAAVHIRYVSKTADIQVSEVKDLNSKLYRARLVGLNEDDARESCHLLSTTQLSCVIIPPLKPDQVAFIQE